MAQPDLLTITHLSLRDFRCFEQIDIDLESPVSILVGGNGSGKTSVAESLHYASYLKSFRSNAPREMVRFDQKAFSIGVSVAREDVRASVMPSETIKINFSGNKRTVKVNERTINSFEELSKTISLLFLTDDDLEIVRGGPHTRRALLDRTLALCGPDTLKIMRDLKTVVDNKNALLRSGRVNRKMYDVLSQQLWEKSLILSTMRSELALEIDKEVEQLHGQFVSDSPNPAIFYRQAIQLGDSFESFEKGANSLFEREQRFGRCLFGAQLDDLVFEQKDKRSRYFSSRGQQKLLVLCIKIAQQKIISRKKHFLLPMVLDDFLSDFDEKVCKNALSMLQKSQSQLLLTVPSAKNRLPQVLADLKAPVFQLNT